MSVESKRKENESVNVFLRRFTEKVKRSGVINKYKNQQFYTQPKSQKIKKQSALQKKNKMEKLNFLRKTGRVK